ncbi:MAG: dipeptidase [Smithellaceae bacterium]
MKRREFLGYCVAAGVTIGLGGLGSWVEANTSLSQADIDQLRGLRIADAHAHPCQLIAGGKYDATTPTIEIMKQIGMFASSFSAVGDRGGITLTFNQLKKVKKMAEEKQVKLILTASDILSLKVSNYLPGAIMAIEGADALEGKIENLDRFYDYGVRIITVLHDRNNELGFNQRSQSDGPLTAFGIQIVEKMNELGMLIDVAHSKTGTLKGIVEVSKAPIIDSHTNPLPYGYETNSRSQRLRTWPEMELIAKTGGLICTWPYAYFNDKIQRTTLKHWAEEILQMKTRLGIEHCGFGTDGGGHLPQVVKGWESIASLPKLIAAMREVGLSQDDIVAYVGGNFLRILNGCLGKQG